MSEGKSFPLFSTVVVLVLLGSIVAGLTGCRVSETEVEITLITRFIQLKVLEEAPLGPNLELRFLDIEGFRRINPMGAFKVDEFPTRMTLWAEEDASGRITFGPGMAKSGTEISVESLAGGRYEIRLGASANQPTLSLKGQLEMALGDSAAGSAPIFKRSQPIGLEPGEGPVVVTLEPRVASEEKETVTKETAPRTSISTGILLFEQVPVELLGFGKSVTFHNAEYAVKRDLSLIESGTILMRDINDREHTLRPGDTLVLAEPGRLSGVARRISLVDEGIALSFNGSARDLNLKVGLGKKRSLMPRQLKWLHSQESLMLFWAALVYLAGIAVSIATKWTELK